MHLRIIKATMSSEYHSTTHDFQGQVLIPVMKELIAESRGLSQADLTIAIRKITYLELCQI